MTSLHRVVFVSAALASFAMAAVACSDDDDRKTFETGGVDSGTDARQPTPPAEAGPVESGTDAGNDFDAADEPVVCDVEPCAVDIAAGQNHFCVLMSDKTARCWGDDSLGQLGAGMPAPDPEPDAGPVRVVQGLTNVTQISAGGTTTCGRLVDGTVECWGGNDVGQLGLTADPPTSDWNPHPTAAAVAVSGALRVDVGVHSACAIVTSGDVLCWGANDQAQLARSVEATIGGPAKIDALSGKTVQTGAGTNTSFAVHQDGTISSWGATTGTSGTIAGRLASVSPDLLPGALLLDGVTSFAVSPWRVDSPWPAPDRGLAHACAVAEGRLYCWGDSMLGAMGFGVPFAFVRPTLVPIQGEARPQRAAVSMEISCVRMSDGTVQCAGDDSHGQLGRGADAGLFSDFFTPAKAFDGHALRVAVSDETVCVVVRGGKVMCWGGNAYGELALGSIDDSPHPTPTLVQF